MRFLKNILIGIGKPFYWIFTTFKSKYWLVMILIIIVGGLSFSAGYIYRETIGSLPDIDKIEILPPMSSKIVDRQGRLLYKFYRDENRSWIPLDRIPQSLIWATIAVEDKEFYKHNGFSVKGIIRAAIFNIKNKGEMRGGSTITQQLVKNVFLSNEKTWKRKIVEAILAVMLEWKLDKNQILERYFNQVAYGGEAYGVQEASMKYFGKNIWEINMAEATFLAGLPAAPSLYSPYKDIELSWARQKQVVTEMVEAGYINEEVATDILTTKIEISKSQTEIKYPHFVFYVKDYLEKELGFTNVDRQGLTIATTIDSEIQDMTEKIVAEEVAKVANLHISNGAAVVIDMENGDVLAMVGSKDYWASDIDGKFNVTLSPRQPGSSIKPINYSLAFNRGMSLLSSIDDSPVTYKIAGQKNYSPKNYNDKYAGRVTLKQAIASSLNVPSVKLLNENGIKNMIELGKKMGITSWEDKNRFGLSLALGAGEVKMIELAGAYSTFARLGNRVVINPIVKIKNYKNEIIMAKEIKTVEVMDEKIAFLINMALSDDKARQLVFAPGSKLNIPGKTVAVKTGTSNNLRDNWCIGWTPSVMVVAWVGNNDNTPMSWVASGISGATPIWNRVMSQLLSNKQDENWSAPVGVYMQNVCGKDEYFIDGTEKNVSCIRVSPTEPDTNRLEQ